MPVRSLKNAIVGILVTVIGGFILALMVAECKETRSTHDSVIRMEAELKKLNDAKERDK